MRELDRLHKDSIFASRKGHRIRSLLVTFSKIWSLLVTFSAYYLNTPRDYINHLIDKSFDSHQEYTIANSYLAPARGTLKILYIANYQALTKSLIFLSPKFDHIWSHLRHLQTPSETNNQWEDFTVNERISGLLKKRGTLVLSLAKPLLISNDVRLFRQWIPEVYLGNNP